MNDMFVAAGATTYPLNRPQRSTIIGVICSPHFELQEAKGQMLFLHKTYTRKALCFSKEYSFFLAVWSERECKMTTSICEATTAKSSEYKTQSSVAAVQVGQCKIGRTALYVSLVTMIFATKASSEKGQRKLPDHHCEYHLCSTSLTLPRNQKR